MIANHLLQRSAKNARPLKSSEYKMLIGGTKFHLDACKDKDYQERILLMYRSLAEFLTMHGFTKNDLFEKFLSSPTTFVFYKEDLTDAGFNWIKINLDKWMRNLDRRKNPIKYDDYMSSLEKTLK